MRAAVVALLCAGALLAVADAAALGRKGKQSQWQGALIAIDAALGQYSVQVAPPPACSGTGPKGVCVDIDNFRCDNGQLLRGRCKGDNSMLCCTGTPAEKDGAVAATIPTTPFPVNPPQPQPAIPDRSVAFKATLTPAGIATLNKLVNSVLQKQLAKPIVIPDQTLSIPSPQLGTFGMTVKNLFVSNVAIGPVSVAVQPPASVSASVTGGNAQAEADFSWTRTTFPRVGGSGHLQVAVADLAVSFTLSVTAVNSKLAIAMTSSKVVIDRLNFKFSQSWDSFVLNAITSLFMAQLKPLIQTQVAAGIIPQFNAQIKAILDGLPTSTTFPAGEMKCNLRFGFETVQAGADGLTLGESFAVDCE